MNRRSLSIKALLSISAMAVMVALPSLSRSADPDAGIADLQRSWAVIQYQTPAQAREARFESLAGKAHSLTADYPNWAETHIWEGIILSSWAGAKGGIGALQIAKQAKNEFEQALRIDPKALDGSALNSLGVLYYKVPGWPLGFGDDKKAEELLHKALEINPDGIDPNYFYADYLVYRDRKAEAVPYLEKALKAPARPGREVADLGRRQEVHDLLQQVRE